MSRPHEDGSPQQSLRFAADHDHANVSLPKNKSTGNLLAQGRQYPHPAVSRSGKRSSFDAGQLDRMARSPIVPEHEHGLGASGLRRIRQQPPRLSGLSSRAASLTINPTPPASRRPSGVAPSPSAPSSPVEECGEDLRRFPTESLHSFSFATQAEEFVQNRQNVLKRSIDFMRDRLGWAATNPGIANAQAKLSGDLEVQSMLELLTRANLIGQDAQGAHGLGAAGPVTGPADLSGENIFEKTLLRSESPESMQVVEAGEAGEADDAGTTGANAAHASEAPTLRPPPRSALKRTLTDVAPLSIQSQLNDALAQPYLVSDQAQSNPTASPSVISANGPLAFASGTTPHSAGAHGPGNRWAPANQAIFTTLATAPWTITAANDLACLVFGVTKSEVRKIGILEVVREERRKWLEEKLSNPRIGSKVAAQETPTTPPTSNTNTSTLRVGNGVTAKLLSKPSSRQVAQSRRAKTDDGSGSSYANRDKTKRNLHHEQKGSRGVLLCGDVVPILKRNGATGAASLWVKEKRGGLIWVLEEIAEDVVEIAVDELGCVWQAKGALEAVFGTERLRRGMDLKRVIPGIIRIEGTNTGALDYDAIDETRYFTALTANSINIPVTVEAVHDEPAFRISSYPHIAGIVVLSAQDLRIASTNSVFSSALFGQPRPEGEHINELLPGFDDILKVMTDEDNIELVDGIVIPEHSFRRARALLAIREGRADAAAIFLRPSGLPAQHRDGNEIMVDVQMRVVRNSPSIRVSEEVIAEDGVATPPKPPSQDLVYALWITYSRHLHASNHGLGPLTPVISRPATPPHQPSPGQSLLASPEPTTPGPPSTEDKATSLLTAQIREAAAREISSPAEPAAKQLHDAPAASEPARKKTIDDFVVLEDMGQGAYGQVKLCRSKKNPSSVSVIKYVTKRRILVDTWTRDRTLGTVPLEIHVLSYLSRPELRHPNIVLMTAFWEDDVNYYIEMAPHGLPGMDLFDYIELRVDMGEAECRRIFKQVASAVGWLHGKAKVVHRDIKDENVVLDGEGRCRLVDFGSAQYVKNGPFDVFVGTIDYAAPEVLSGSPYRGREQDVWALGILLYTIIYKENPFYSIDEITDHDLRVPWVMSESSIELVRRMLDRDVERRITIGGVLESEWVRGGEFEEVGEGEG